MRIKHNFLVDFATLFTMMVFAVLLQACGGGGASSTSSSSTVTTSSPSTTQTVATSGSNQTGTANTALTTIPSTTGNVASVVVDAGPVTGTASINVAYVSVTVCTPGTSGSTAACQTIDHVTLDTGSYGLRLVNSALSSSLNLPAASTNGRAIGECVQFVVGSTWGSVRMADIYIGGEVAKNVPIQDIGDNPGGAPSVPTDCSNTGAVQDTQAALGSNGILGVGVFVNDCDACLTKALTAAYYTCTSSGCSNSTVTSAQVVRNPVASFQNPSTGATQDNNGTVIVLPAVAAAGSTGLTGSLIFGIGTRTNNALNTASVYATDSFGNFTTTYKGVSLKSSYLDSGSNGLFFNDTSIPTCSVNTWAYCPTTAPLSLSATNTSYNTSTSAAVSFSLANANSLFSNSSIVAGNIGGPSGSSSYFAWGLPFFYGKSVYTAISGVSVSGVPIGPYWAY